MDRGERATDRKTPVAKGKWRRSGGRAVKICAPYPGRSRFTPERATSSQRRSEKSAEAIVAVGGGEGPNERKSRQPSGSESHNVTAARLLPEILVRVIVGLSVDLHGLRTVRELILLVAHGCVGQYVALFPVV